MAMSPSKGVVTKEALKPYLALVRIPPARATLFDLKPLCSLPAP